MAININTLITGSMAIGSSSGGSSGNTYPIWVDPVYSDELIP
jgi:hypothetical protein